MQFTIASAHQDFFSDHQYIEFSNVFSLDEMKVLQDAIHSVLTQREQKIIETHSAKELFKAGRDLWRDNSAIKKIVLSRRLAKIASPLFQKPIIRIAYDQALCSFSPGEPLFPEPFSLQKVSCFQPICGAVILRLTDDPNPPAILPQKVGSALFVGPNFPLPWSSFLQQTPSSFFIIVYCTDKTVYVLEKQDSHTHALKKLGYGLGDRLEERTHPIIFNRKA